MLQCSMRGVKFQLSNAENGAGEGDIAPVFEHLQVSLRRQPQWAGCCLTLVCAFRTVGVSRLWISSKEWPKNRLALLRATTLDGSRRAANM